MKIVIIGLMLAWPGLALGRTGPVGGGPGSGPPAATLAGAAAESGAAPDAGADFARLAAAPDTLAAVAAADTVGELRLIKAVDTLGRDISGNRQTLSPRGAASRPLLVQVLDARGAPVSGAAVVFRIEPGFEPDGRARSNGTLSPLVPKRDGSPGYEPRPAALTPAADSSRLSVRSDLLGCAGVHVLPGKSVEPLRVTAALPQDRDETTAFVLRVVDPRWTLLLLSGLLGGLALFLVGMRMTTTGLEQVAGNRLRAILGRVTDNRLLGLLTGTVVTALVQSSSATTVMLVSFANAGLLSLRQALAIILGADVGTTLTVQLLAFPLKDYSLLIVFAGFALSALPRHRHVSLGQFVLGVGLIFYGMSLMSRAMEPLADLPAFRQLLVSGQEHPVLVLLAAVVFTALIHNSAATIGIALTLAFQGLIGLETAIPVIFGANIGTCVTAALAAFGAHREAQRVALAHVFFKVAAVALMLPLTGPFAALVARTAPDLARQIANAHTLFNVAAALVFLPALDGAARLLGRLVGDRPEERERVWTPKYIDERILEVPAIALAQVQREIGRMGDAVLRMLRGGAEVFRDRDAEKLRVVVALDNKVDALDEALRRYLTRMGRRELGAEQAARVASLLYTVHHLETIGDLISKNLMGLAEKVFRDDLHFSTEGARQWSAYYDDVLAMLEQALLAFATHDHGLARAVVARKAEMARRARNLHFEHLDRLGKGIPESEATSSIHIHLISDLRRIVSNAASIGAAVVNEYQLPDEGPVARPPEGGGDGDEIGE